MNLKWFVVWWFEFGHETGKLKSRLAKDAIWPPWMAEHAKELSGTILARLLDCRVLAADGLYLSLPIPCP